METRARVIVFDIAAFESDGALQRRSSSLIPHSIDHPYRTVSREHSGLMSWPDNFFKARHSKQIHDGDDHRQPNNLSARAMQLSIYGSMVSSFSASREMSPSSIDSDRHCYNFSSVIPISQQKLTGWFLFLVVFTTSTLLLSYHKVDVHHRGRSFTQPTQTRTQHSLSYPRVPSHHGRTLLSVKSEGAATATATAAAMRRRRSSLDARRPDLQVTPPPQQHNADTREAPAGHDDSSDDSGADEIIVRIDSPSLLSFRQAS